MSKSLDLALLKMLQENVDTPNDETWHVCVAWDGSGELLLDETPVAIFDTILELKTYVKALIQSTKTLTVSLILEVLREVQQ